MSCFDDAFERLILVEGGYSNNPYDRGGKTAYGITERVARANGYTEAMENLPLDKAKEIYKEQYWDLLKLTPVSVLSCPLAEEMFEIGVNMGVGRATTFLQRVLNATNKSGQDWMDISVDGAMGPMTLDALGMLYKRRGDEGLEVVKKAINCLQGARYVELAEADVSQEAFVYGWLRARV